MVNPISLLNLVHQKTKYSPALGKADAAKLEAGQTLTSVASELRVSRASLRNWRSRDSCSRTDAGEALPLVLSA